MIANRQNQRTSAAEKQTEKWYIPNIQYFISLATSLNDKDDTLRNLNGANGIIDKKIFNYVLNPIQHNSLKGKNDIVDKLPGEIRDVDFINPIREKNIGEYLNLPNTFTVKVDDPNISLLRDKEVADKLMPLLQQELINIINANNNNPNAIQSNINQQQNQSQGEQVQQQNNYNTNSGIPSTGNIDIKKLADEFIEKWFDKRAINAQNLIEWIKDNNNFEDLRTTLFNYWWATEQAYVYISLENNMIKWDIISSLEGYPISNGSEFIEDHDAFVIIRNMSLTQIYEYYDDKLSDKDRQYLNLLNSRAVDGIATVSRSLIQNIYGRREFLFDGVSENISINTNAQIREVILFFKTYTRRSILYKYNQLGNIVSEVVDNNFEINPELGHINIEYEWILETWKQVLIGADYSGIYLKPEPLNVQIYDSLGRNKLPIAGKKGLINGVYINPIPKRILPNLALYRIITLHIEREFAKFKGTMELIPKSLLIGDKGDVKGNMFYRLATNTIIYDDTNLQSAIQGYRLVGDNSAVTYIKALIDFRDVIKAEAWDMANMNDSRYGNAPASSTVSNNQQNIFRARLGSTLMINTFNSILLRLYTQTLEYAKYAYVNGVSGVIRNNDNEKPIYFNIDEGELTENNYGIFVSNAISDLQKLEEYKKLAFSASQNGDFDIAMTAIDDDSVSAIRQNIRKFIELRNQREAAIAAAKNKAEEDKLKNEINLVNANHAAKMEEIEREEQLKTDREVKIANIKYNGNFNINNIK